MLEIVQRVTIHGLIDLGDLRLIDLVIYTCHGVGIVVGFYRQIMHLGEGFNFFLLNHVVHYYQICLAKITSFFHLV